MTKECRTRSCPKKNIYMGISAVYELRKMSNYILHLAL